MFLMKQSLRYQRILILSLLGFSVFAPIVLFSIFTSSLVSPKGFVGDLPSIKHKTDTQKLNSMREELEKRLKEPKPVVYKDGDLNSVVNDENLKSKDNTRCGASVFERNVSGTGHDGRVSNQQIQPKNMPPPSGGKVQSNETYRRELNRLSHPQRVSDETVQEMKDQVSRAKAYLNLVPPNSNSRLVEELKVQIKEVKQALGQATKDSDLSMRALQRMRSMEAVLSKSGRIYTDCSRMATKLRAMTYNTEEQVRTQKYQATYLLQLVARTTPKGLHCLLMRLTTEYFALQPEERELPNQHKLQEPDLHHYAVFSDNVLASAVVVNSTISSSVEPDKIVFHLVTDALNFPAMRMWFLLNLPAHATIQIECIDDFEWLSFKYGSALKKQESMEPRYSSALNHLRFYLPDIFPALNKIVLLEHDVVVQKDLGGLWNAQMKGKVNGAVETCRDGDFPFRHIDMLVNFSDSTVAKRLDVKECTWAFGMNVFNLQEWRRQNLAAIYHKYFELGSTGQLWKGGSLPYNQTVALDQRWHVLGLGYESGVGRGEIERAAVIHYNGNMKPWLEIGIGKYKGYWNKYVDYNHPFLQQCNIHE